MDHNRPGTGFGLLGSSYGFLDNNGHRESINIIWSKGCFITGDSVTDFRVGRGGGGGSGALA